MSTEISTFKMAERRCRTDEDPLIPFLQEAHVTPVQISAQDVIRLDAIRLQVLLSARKRWRDEQVSFEVTNITREFQESLALFGLPENEFGEVTDQ